MGLAADVRTALAGLGVRPAKRRGQNFMVSEPDLAAIAAAVEAGPGDVVIEIGPGLGFLTRHLLRSGAHVVAVEKDFVMARYVQNTFHADTGHLTVLEKDALELDLKRDVPDALRVKVAGNIPYNITSPILAWLVAERERVSTAVLTVQREVGERLRAKPGTKEWGSLTLFLRLYADVEILRRLPPGRFYPPPKVESCVVRLRFLSAPRVPVENPAFFFALIRRAFQQRRKTVANALSAQTPAAFSRDRILAALQKASVDPMRRPETLTLEEWSVLAQILA